MDNEFDLKKYRLTEKENVDLIKTPYQYPEERKYPTDEDLVDIFRNLIDAVVEPVIHGSTQL